MKSDDLAQYREISILICITQTGCSEKLTFHTLFNLDYAKLAILLTWFCRACCKNPYNPPDFSYDSPLSNVLRPSLNSNGGIRSFSKPIYAPSSCIQPSAKSNPSGVIFTYQSNSSFLRIIRPCSSRVRQETRKLFGWTVFPIIRFTA